MQTFHDVTIQVYLPAYKDLYKIKANTNKSDMQQTLYFIAQNIKAHDHYAGNVAVIENCNIILRQVSNKASLRSSLDKMLFNLLYSLRSELKSFCVMFYPLNGSHDLKLDKHYTWNIK